MLRKLSFHFYRTKFSENEASTLDSNTIANLNQKLVHYKTFLRSVQSADISDSSQKNSQ